MIESISMTNFKSFDMVNLELGGLNVLSGINGSGKSTVCQALLLLQQCASNSKDSISLNVEPVSLGKLRDIFYQNAENQLIEIIAGEKDSKFGFKVDVSQDHLDDDYAKFNYILIDKENQSEGPSDLVGFISSIKYLAAERLGPRTTQNIDHQTVRVQKHIGVHGQYTNSYLEFYGAEHLDLRFRSHIDAPSEQLAIQAAYWLKNISPNINLITKNHSETDQVSIAYSFDVSLGKSADVRPTNIGFGISYVLPVIVMCLTATPGQTIIIDTPEAHLHPKGQFIIGELIACTAADGVQVIVETHSDHVLNGIRVQTIKDVLAAENSRYYYFELGTGRGYSAPKTIIHNPKINSSGQFDHWPKGFFDEWSYALNEILKLRGKI